MTAFPYVASPDKIPSLFKKIGEMGIPKKFSNTTLKSIGFTSSNDARLANLVKFLGLTDQSGIPTPLWTELRKHPRIAMATAVRTAYSDLFEHYADADQRDTEALRTYFAATSNLGALAVTQMVGTFKAVCKLADFSSQGDAGKADPDGEVQVPPPAEQPPPPERRRAAKFNGGADGLTVNINIQLQLPADATSETYERFFEAMRKHILAPDA
jgi:hypothetical protein